MVYSHPSPFAGISFSHEPVNRESALRELNNQWEKGYLENDTHPKGCGDGDDGVESSHKARGSSGSSSEL